MYRVMMYSAAAMTALSVTAALADDKLKGTYTFSGTQICLAAPEGFKDDGHGNAVVAIGTNAFDASNNFWGTTTYNGDGTGKVTGKFTGIAVPTPAMGPSGAGGGTFTYQFTHTPISGNEYATSAVAGTYQGTITIGARAGQTFTINKNERTLTISTDQKSITSTNATPYVEEITYSGDPKGPFQRICHTASTLFKLQ